MNDIKLALFIIGFLCAMVGYHTLVGAEENLVLAQGGKAMATIVLPNEPTPVERTAARELHRHLSQITGNDDWKIVTESEIEKEETLIFVGDSRSAREFFQNVDFKEIPYDGIVIKTCDDKLLLAGHEQRGVLYAVNTFLEDTLGCRWWTSTESMIPHLQDIVIAPLDVQYAPKLIYRESFYKDAFEPVFATRMKCNGANEPIPAEYGGHHSFAYFVHSFYQLIPPSKYFDDHPDWFSEINGVRKHDHMQLCLTNDEMRAELTKNALEKLRENPEAKFISISQNDWMNPCQCEKCRAVVEEEGSEAGPLVSFVNKVAADIEKEFPDVWVETLAYQYTRKPPKKVKARKNVLIRLCTIDCSFVQSLEHGEQNKALRDDIEGWSKTAEHLFIWDYVTNFSAFLIPHPNYEVVPKNIRFFVDHGAIGLFEQGDAFTTVGDFVRLRNWVISHLMWDPAQDEEKLIDEFLNGYYGNEVASFFKEYFDLLTKRAENSGVHLGCFRNNTSDWLDYETLCAATELMNDAIKVTERNYGTDSLGTWRIRREKMPIDYVWLQGYFSLKRHANVNHLPFLGPQDPLEGSNAYLALCDRFENEAHREFTGMHPFDVFRINLLQRFNDKAAIPDICKELPEESWLDCQEYDTTVHQGYDWAKYVEDDAASNGRAIRMPGDHSEWAVSHSMDATLNDLVSINGGDSKSGIFRVYAAIRCEATVEDGPAMFFGVYDWANDKRLGQGKTVSVDEIKGNEYTLIEIGDYPLNSHSFIWASPPTRPGEVTAVYIDRFIVSIPL